MPVEYKFVNGDGGESHLRKLNEAAHDGWLAILMAANSGQLGVDMGATVIVLMEKELPPIP